MLTGLSPSMVSFSKELQLNLKSGICSSKHHISHALRRAIQFALCRFRSPLLTASRLISFPPATKMFQFAGLLLAKQVTHITACREVSFGDPRILACVRLPVAYHSLPRPSSASEPSHPPNSVVAYYSGVSLCTTSLTMIHGTSGCLYFQVHLTLEAHEENRLNHNFGAQRHYWLIIYHQPNLLMRNFRIYKCYDI